MSSQRVDISSVVCRRDGSPSHCIRHSQRIFQMRKHESERIIVNSLFAPGRGALVGDRKFVMPHPSIDPRVRFSQGRPFRDHSFLARGQMVACPDAVHDRSVCWRVLVSWQTWQ